MSISRIIFLVCIPYKVVFGQVDTSKNKLVDVIDVWHLVFSKNYSIDTSKAKVKEPLLSILPGFGYSQLTGFTVLVDGNISFYTQPNTNISVIKLTPEYAQNKQFTPILTTSIWTKNNQYNFVSDWRYYNYKVIDFGLGGSTNPFIFNTYSYQFLRFHQLLSRSISSNFLLGIGYNFDKHFNIIQNESQLNTNVSNYEITKPTLSSGLVFNVLYDSRKNENSPVSGGWYFNSSFIKNFKFLKSSSNYYSLYSDFRHYVSLPQGSNNILAFWNINWLTFGGQSPYFDLPSTLWDTYDNAGRTFIQGRFRGKNMLYYEAEYRFDIIKNQLLGGAFFANIQSFSEPQNKHFSNPILGYGASLRTKVNKKSKVYFVVSYGLGKGGARGFFFNLGDVY
ncbi:hypothetical protein Emtol_3790 [Emticicia oligotrophica DSM 17448]|uniref:Bacterial surface antigen (D15) domain-containing protein n=1 Tax=Emticicia oligotrophica (strain DSM 17448 / CIP 109782 / MTCC 6937 / GPTSA100-15) TaxID=929562 RepID=A0ABN4ASD2_EMTOG|nr:hypothetical protein [Emticicia oligotrophica]AFK04916.1 hypothetical protein Emtol_3790 [Emticicia oligotrophica DSM 17448]